MEEMNQLDCFHSHDQDREPDRSWKVKRPPGALERNAALELFRRNWLRRGLDGCDLACRHCPCMSNGDLDGRVFAVPSTMTGVTASGVLPFIRYPANRGCDAKRTRSPRATVRCSRSWKCRHASPVTRNEQKPCTAAIADRASEQIAVDRTVMNTHVDAATGELLRIWRLGVLAIS